jgi:hypothetical protein
VLALVVYFNVSASAKFTHVSRLYLFGDFSFGWCLTGAFAKLPGILAGYLVNASFFLSRE